MLKDDLLWKQKQMRIDNWENQMDMQEQHWNALLESNTNGEGKRKSTLHTWRQNIQQSKQPVQK